MAEKRTLTVESQYCSNWTVKDAIRELIQNAVDTGTKVEFHQHNAKRWVIKDNGSGMQLSDFLVGRTSKANNAQAIGQFGEGAPIGCLVLARNGRDVKVYSKGKKYAFSFEHDSQWGCPLLTITIDEAPTDKGTAVVVECTAGEMVGVKSLFLAFSPKTVIAKTKKAEILQEMGSIYVNGLLVSTARSLFGYNFLGQKELVNRDRNAIGSMETMSAIREAIEATTNLDIIKQILKAGYKGEPRDSVEVSYRLCPKYGNNWKMAIKQLWGTKVCLSDNPVHDMQAIERNWTVLDMPWGLHKTLEGLNIITSSMAINDGKRRKYVLQRELSREERENLEKGKRISKTIAEIARLDTYPIKIFLDVNKGTGTAMFENLGRFSGGIVEIERSLLQGDTNKLVGTIIHECVHGTTGHTDFTRNFENSLCNIIASIGIRYCQEAK